MITNLGTLLRYRSLIINLALKDLRVKYRSPFLGFLWAFLTPLCTVIIFHIVFSLILRVPAQDYPFFIYLMTAIFSWRFFQVSITRAMMSIVDNKSLVKEVAFPRELLPLSVIVAELFNYIPSLAIILIFLPCFGIPFSILIVFLPLVVFLHFLFALGIALLVSALQVKYRDTQYIIEIVLTGLFYLTPVFYWLNSVTQFFSKPFLMLYLFNPLVGMLNLYRIVLLKGFITTLAPEVTISNLIVSPLVVPPINIVRLEGGSIS